MLDKDKVEKSHYHYRVVVDVGRADKNYFIILIPKSTTISDSAIAQLESSKR